ncbi:MAG: penicillin-binding protein 2 [Campylobacteraceae bacterium]|nr:penicillin-binding protein 2 [Campylobacteraceae bacterium]
MRIRILLTFFGVIWIILLVRIYYISIKSNAYYEEIAKQNAIKVEYLAPVRGSIKDVKSRPLSVNELGFSIAIKPHLSKKSKLAILDKEIDLICSLFSSLDKKKIKKIYLKEDSPYGQNYVVIVEFIPYDEMMPYFSRLSLRENIKVRPATKRHYPYGKLASHIIGYVAKANQKDMKSDSLTKLTSYVGRAGVEKFYNSTLQGKKGKRKIKVTAFNEEMEEVSKTLPTSSNIELTIDLELQKYLAELFKDDSGVAIVMNVNDGSILAAGSFPEYDINKFTNGISHKEWKELSTDLNHPFTNKIINGLYPPGSVVKMGIALALLDTHKVTKHATTKCTGSFKLGKRNFRCWSSWGHGLVDMNRAIRESCDDYFYKGSLKVGIDEIAPVLQRLGFGNKTGVDLPNEFIGIVPSRTWKMQKYQQPWYQGETLNTAIGQGSFLVTPLQVAKYTAILASKRSVTPHFIKAIDGKPIEYKVDHFALNDFEKSQIRYIQQAMYEVANHPKGTAKKGLADSLVTLAAKTGTAQVVGISQTEKERMREEDMEYYRRSHAWLTTYGPYANPKYVVTILLEHGGHGGSAAGPIAVKIYNKLLKMDYLAK